LWVADSPGSARNGHFSKGLAGYNIGNVQQFFKKYLQCALAARILTVDFVVCTLAVKKKKKIRGRFRHVGSDHSLVRIQSYDDLVVITMMMVIMNDNDSGYDCIIQKKYYLGWLIFLCKSLCICFYMVTVIFPLRWLIADL
jgi:hypothetical protein